jgi:hypothetical protein
MATPISLTVETGDVLQTKSDVLVLKYAQALYGVDAAVVERLEAAGISLRSQLPRPGMFRLIPTQGALMATSVLFLGMPELWNFDYAAIREFGARALSSLSGAPQTRRVVLTVHGPNFGLDESESLRAEVAGLLDSIARSEYPESLEAVAIVERDAGRAKRLQDVLYTVLRGRQVEARPGPTTSEVLSATRRSLSDVGERSIEKPHLFAAMPFAKEFDDRFHYGIQRAAESAGFLCERADLSSFTGDVLNWVRNRIESAAFVVADLTTANPNVYLEVGYAWGRNIPTVLLVSNEQDLKFDVRSQRCLVYDSSIRRLEELLTSELKSLAHGKQ